jgi:hypothetical protein
MYKYIYIAVPAAFGPENDALNKTTQGGIFASEEACSKWQINRFSTVLPPVPRPSPPIHFPCRSPHLQPIIVSCLL